MEYKLTEYSKAAGCGCKIAPQDLQEIIAGLQSNESFLNLIVGNGTNDDAAAFKINDLQSIISTTDFFMPIVDNPFDFGAIAATNALSDVYAMGGKPLMAVAILGWPIQKIPAHIASQVLKGAESICKNAGIPLAGGHSIECQEPIFGLALTGIIDTINIKRNNTIKENDVLYLTKPIGTGVLSTALKRNVLEIVHYDVLLKNMTTLNSIGTFLASKKYVHALTDITGFGLLGHLLEMLSKNDYSAVLNYNDIPLIDGLTEYLSKFIYPDNTTRNFNAYKEYTENMTGLDFLVLCDPQTSGGLLISVDGNESLEFEKFMQEQNQYYKKIGAIITKKEKAVVIIK